MKPIMSEKAVRMIEIDNTIVFELDRRLTKKEIRKQIEESFKVKVDSINTLIKMNKKYAYVKLNKNNPAIDIATKLGMI
ncbi:50S ribosomal protein L23 [Candidatus Pacearchaeota archaeon]|nr:50S ribosomal protein L23 [Candidatus Pacearchaeota archaeon]